MQLSKFRPQGLKVWRMTKLPEEVREADVIIARIRGKPTANELIEEQKDRPEEDDEPEEKEYPHYCHTMDGHSSGSFVYTGIGSGLNPHETTLTRLTERKR